MGILFNKSWNLLQLMAGGCLDAFMENLNLSADYPVQSGLHRISRFTGTRGINLALFFYPFR